MSLPETRPPVPLPPQLPPESQWRLLLRALRTWWGWLLGLFALVGAFGTVLGTFDFWQAIYADTMPEIEAPGPNDSPFVLPFIVKNNSHFLPMTHVSWDCGPNFVAEDGGADVITFTIADDPPSEIPKEGQVAFRCSVVIQQGPSPTIEPVIHYRTLWFNRVFHCKKFTWYPTAKPPRWIETDLPD